MVFITSTPPLNLMETNLKGPETRRAGFTQSAGSTPRNAICYIYLLDLI